MIEEYHSGTANPTDNPFYETPGDVLETLNLELGAQITRAAGAALVELADE